jgi:DNA-binding IclR family transcriptional regulator
VPGESLFAAPYRLRPDCIFEPVQHIAILTMTRNRKSKCAPVGVVGKVLRILESLDNSPTGLNLRQISLQTGVNKSTAYRFLSHLESAGYLFREEAGSYVIGPRLANFGSGMAHHARLRKTSRPILEKVWRATKETVNLAVLDGQNVLFLDVIESPQMFRMGSQVGMRMALNCTALGKAILAFLPSEQREEMLGSLTFTRVTPRTIMDATCLRKELGKVFRQGYALDDEEGNLGARCVAAPILDGSGKILAAVSITGPATRITRDKISSLGTSVKSTAKEISSRLNRFD